ncbi:hypothetical protein [Brachyspira hampsonii]|uniref:hypothetical protein n=1 Tax=Brachyspira hampsonii TaxID=1287055 RepID=UPI0002ADE810|nr:hypothetical protein [Brachyspira hampsonii]ELV06346.1 hypothetical protein H263_04748 [Brachyspira hampsonii 30599]
MDVILEYIEKKNINDEDIMFLIQATSPLIEPTHIDDMYKKMTKRKFTICFNLRGMQKIFLD